MKTAAIYIRVSTDAQREEGYSIDAQKEMLSSYLISKNIKEYDYYIDGGFTGSNIARPELTRLINNVKQNKIDTVIVYKLDRLSRSQKDTLYLIEDVFNPYNVDFISLNESMDTSTPLGRLMLGILSAFAQLERENIRERTRMGMKERVKTGLWMGGGRIPFGYDYDKKSGILVPNEEAKIVRQIYSLYIDGHSTAKIAQIVGLKYEKLAYQILRRKSNAGYIRYNGEEYLGQHKPIISLETYEKAMNLMNQRSNIKSLNSNYLLTGLIYCGKCGSKMRYQKWGKIDAKIICYSQDKSKIHLIKDPNCDNKRMWSSELEDIIIKDLFQFSINLKENNETNKDFYNVHDLLKSQYQTTHNKIKKLYNLYANSDDDILLDTINELKDTLSNLGKKIEIEEDKEKKDKKNTEILKNIESIQDIWSYMTKLEQKNIIHQLVEKIILTDDDIKIYYKI